MTKRIISIHTAIYFSTYLGTYYKKGTPPYLVQIHSIKGGRHFFYKTKNNKTNLST